LELTIDEQLWKWITVAAEKREALRFPAGMLEEGIHLIRKYFGDEWLKPRPIELPKRLDTFGGVHTRWVPRFWT
jgi:hypothetical protein